jgi:hypothetical protein
MIMTDDRLRQLIDHPPRDLEHAPDPAFTAVVMARVELTAPPRHLRTLAWCAAAAVAIVVSLPVDGIPAIDDFAGWIDGELVVELCATALVGAIVLAVSIDRTSPRRISA